MIPQASITAWRNVVPWAEDAQVEQDLVLSRAVVELFADSHVASKIALRGGTALQKLVLEPARYSEDIDLVQTETAPIGPMLDAIRAILDPWLDKPKRNSGPGTVSLVYRFESEIAPVRPLRLKIEINTREHFAICGLQRRPLSVQNPWFTGTCDIVSFANNELMGTKLRALYQRRKGRDLFDLWLCLDRGLIDPPAVVDCFLEYMRRENHQITRAQYEENLFHKEQDKAFMGDTAPLIRPGLGYDPQVALAAVRGDLIERLPGNPWHGPGNSERKKPVKKRRRN